MNISIESLSSNQNGIEYTWSNNGGEESEIEKMDREKFASLLCKHSDGNYVHLHRHDIGLNYVVEKQSIQVSEDEFIDGQIATREFVENKLNHDYEYCKECLIKFLESQNKN